MSAPSVRFRFVQVELAWPLGPPDGRYLVREPGDDRGPPTHVVLFATLGAPERRRLTGRRRTRESASEPPPTPVSTGRATVIDVAAATQPPEQAQRWLERAGETELERGLQVLNRTLRAFRLVTADPYVMPVSRDQLLTARLGYGQGDQVADGLWEGARELVRPARRQRRAQVLIPQARLAAILGGRQPMLACEELILRARLDLDQERPREAALQVMVALDAALAELAADPAAPELTERLAELRAQREEVIAAAQSALTGPISSAEQEAVAFTVGRLEAALRARAASGA